MFLKQASTNDLVEAVDLQEVFDPFEPCISARTQAGEDTMDMDRFEKSELRFPSGEPLPECWRNSRYRAHAAR
jgi:hypothetical protein